MATGSVRFTLSGKRRLNVPMPFVTEELSPEDVGRDFPEAKTRIHVGGTYWDVAESYDQVGVLISQAR